MHAGQSTQTATSQSFPVALLETPETGQRSAAPQTRQTAAPKVDRSTAAHDAALLQRFVTLTQAQPLPRCAAQALAMEAAGVEWCAEPPLEAVRKRAYFIYLERAGVPGDPVADWLQAERELRQESGWPRSRFIPES